MPEKNDDHWVTRIRSRPPYRSVYEKNRPTETRSSTDWKTVVGALLVMLLVIAGVMIAMRSMEPADGWADLIELRVTTDEAFLYLFLKTSGSDELDWEGRAYRIAIDTYDSDRGSRVLPAPLEASTGTGVEFLVDLQGPDRSRLLVVNGYDPFDGEGSIFSARNNDPGFRPLYLQTNRERFSRDGTRFAPLKIERGALRFDDPTATSHGEADVATGDGFFEVRIPWALLNVTDPSSRSVIHSVEAGREKIGVIRTPGFRIYAFSFSANEEGRMELVDEIPSGEKAAPIYAWSTWERPEYALQPKKGLDLVKEAMAELPDHPVAARVETTLTASE